MRAPATNRTGLPSLRTYWEIVIGIFLTYLSIVLILLYFYVLYFGIIPARSRLNPMFYRSVAVLAVGDLLVLFCSMRESVVQDCVLQLKPARHMAWQTLGTLAVELIVGSNLALSLSRALSIFGYEKASQRVSSLLLLFFLLWSTSLAVMNHFGLVDIVWFTGDEYYDRFVFPFDYIRMPFLFSEVGLTALFHLISAMTIRRLFRAYNRRTSELKLFIISLLVFFIELEFIYATFWIGDQFHIGEPEFNANLDYTTRPLATGLTPLIYVCCSSEIRGALRSTIPCLKTSKKPFQMSTQTNNLSRNK